MSLQNTLSLLAFGSDISVRYCHVIHNHYFTQINIMKQIVIALVLILAGARVQAQKVEWKELSDYHTVMAQTFHPSEEGDLKPIKARSGELATKAKALQKSMVPAAYQKPGVKETLKLLAKESKAVDKMVRKGKASDADLTKALSALHDRFHEVMEKCNH